MNTEKYRKIMHGQSDLPNDSGLAESLRKRFWRESYLVAVPRVRRMPRYRCWLNVGELVEAEGGNVVFGWGLVQWPGRFIEAFGHAVWQIGGQLSDVTAEPYDGCTSSLTTFVPDPSFKKPIHLSESVVLPRFVQLDDDPDTFQYIQCSLAIARLQEALYLYRQCSGLEISTDPEGRTAISGPRPLINEYVRLQDGVLREQDRRIDMHARLLAIDAEDSR